MSNQRIELPKDKGWTRLGPGGGGSMFHPTVSPHDPNTAAITCDMTGQYITRDGGRRWHMTNLMIWCDCFAFDPVDPDRLYAGANALYCTDDFGESWQMLWPGAESGRETHLHGDEASPAYLGEGWPGGRVTALAVDPRDNQRLLAAVSAGGRPESEGESALHLSTDRGKSWTRLSALRGGRVHQLAIDARSQDIWAITSFCLFLSEDGGRKWKQLPGACEGRVVGGAVGFPEDGGTLLYVIAGPQEEQPAGLFVSVDRGESWLHLGAGVQRAITQKGRVWGPPVRAIGICRERPEIAYLAVSLEAEQSGETPKRHIGIVKTTDAGEHWEWAIRAESDKEPDNLDPDWLTKSYGSMWPDYPFGMGVSATDPDICYATDMGRAIMTKDGGAHWQRVINEFDEEGGSWTTGLDVTTCYGIHFDPHDPDVAFISYTDIGLHKSTNRGLSWHHRLAGTPRPWRNTCYWLVFDPQLPGKIWSVWSGGHDYPRLKMFRRTDVRRFRGGVCVSDDNGETWRPTMTGMPEVGCTHILLNPDSPKGQRTLYVTAFGRGVYKSTDDGASWALCNKGLGEENLNAWRLARLDSGDIYLVMSRSYRDGQSLPGGIYLSRDDCASWTRLPVSDEIPFPNELCVSPADPRVMYVAAWPVSLPDQVVEGGVFKTADAGQTWKRLPFPGHYVYGVTVDPNEPEVVYATAWFDGVFRSADGGSTWDRLGGANFGWPHLVVPDPFDPDSIYLTTFGGSLWHGPKRGTPGAGADIVGLPPVSQVRP